VVAEKLRSEISEIEHVIDSGAYRLGPWARLLTRARATSGADRLAISAGVTRVSRKLHLRGRRKTISAQTGVTIEAAAIWLGYLLLTLGVYMSSNAVAIVGAALWVMAFQPVVKVATATALGVGYDYVYLSGVSPASRWNTAATWRGRVGRESRCICRARLAIWLAARCLPCRDAGARQIAGDLLGRHDRVLGSQRDQPGVVAGRCRGNQTGWKLSRLPNH
jgi:hypothetical protein